MIETTVGEALKDCGDRLEIASTAAIEKKGRTDEVRVLYDGSNGLDLNPGIRVRDQVKYPTSADAKGWLLRRPMRVAPTSRSSTTSRRPTVAWRSRKASGVARLARSRALLQRQ
jgi:hypothetical protein